MTNHSLGIFLKQASVSLAALLGASLLYGCAANSQSKYQPKYESKYFPPPTDYVPLDQIQIQQKFATVSLTRENLLDEMKKCVPTLAPAGSGVQNLIKEFPGKGLSTIGQLSTSKRFVYRGQTGLCLELSANKYPIYAAETFFATANPVGVPPDVSNDWYMKIAKQIAIKGQAKVIYVMAEKGNAYLVSYWHDQPSGTTLYYASEFKKAGEWEDMQVDYKFSHPNLRGFSKTNRSGGEKKDFPLAEGN